MKSALSLINDHLKSMKPMLQAIIAAGGKPYLVGGAVRDLVLDLPLKDVDIEVHGLELEALEGVLTRFGPVKLVGKQFGVLRSYTADVDWSIPRSDSKGRKPTVSIDPSMTLEHACKRRDITMNAMALDLAHLLTNWNPIITKISSGALVDLSNDLGLRDPFGGLEDIKLKRIRAVDTTLFIEDPLRFYRVMQFLSRFEMDPDHELNTLCASMSLADPETGRPVARERIYEELRKMFLTATRPSRGFRWLEKIGRLKELFPELHALIATSQRADYHPEGNVFEHSMQSLDAAARLPYGDTTHTSAPYVSTDDEKFLIMIASLCHDVGKAVTTDSELHAYGHDVQGVPITTAFLKRFILSPDLSATVGKLVRYHLMPWILLEQKSTPKAYKRLALALSPETTLYQLALVGLCDRNGRNGTGSEPLNHFAPQFTAFITEANKLNLTHQAEKPLLSGRDIADLVNGGPLMGAALKHAYTLQIEENIQDIEVLKKAAAQFLKKQS